MSCWTRVRVLDGQVYEVLPQLGRSGIFLNTLLWIFASLGVKENWHTHNVNTFFFFHQTRKKSSIFKNDHANLCLFTWFIRISALFIDLLPSQRLSHSHMPAGCIFNRSVLNILALRQRANNLSPLAVGLWASFEASPGHFITWQCRPRHLYQPKVTSNRPLRALICSRAKYNPPRDGGNWRNVPFSRKSSWLSLAAFQARRLPRKNNACF